MNSPIPFTKTPRYHHCRLSPLQFLQHLLVQYKQQALVPRISLHGLLKLTHGLPKKPSQHLQFVPPGTSNANQSSVTKLTCVLPASRRHNFVIRNTKCITYALSLLSFIKHHENKTNCKSHAHKQPPHYTLFCQTDKRFRMCWKNVPSSGKLKYYWLT